MINIFHKIRLLKGIIIKERKLLLKRDIFCQRYLFFYLTSLIKVNEGKHS